MQNVGAAWFMASLTDSPLIVPLVQSATYLPVVLVGMFAGALADVVDRRRLLLTTQAWMMLAAAGPAVATLTGVVTPPGAARPDVRVRDRLRLHWACLEGGHR